MYNFILKKVPQSILQIYIEADDVLVSRDNISELRCPKASSNFEVPLTRKETSGT